VRAVAARNLGVCRFVGSLSGPKGCAVAAGPPANPDSCKRLLHGRDAGGGQRCEHVVHLRHVPDPGQRHVHADVADHRIATVSGGDACRTKLSRQGMPPRRRHARAGCRARHGQVWGDLKRCSTSRQRRDLYQADHRAIVEALGARDADGAVEAMRRHLGRVAEHLLGAH